MKEFFKQWNPKEESITLVDWANVIIDEYEEQGYTLTLRQLYYQFVARDIIENTERSYKNLGTLITKARMSGMISWKAIEDRNRTNHLFWFEEDPLEPIYDLPGMIRFNQWERQDTYIEVWVEKEALGGVVAKACNPLLVPHMACKGYLSASEAWRAAKRFEHHAQMGKQGILIHLGDHDPSGMDMTRDNRDRIDLLSYQSGVEVLRIALNMDQIDAYNPPPNPAKLSDSRAKDYISNYGSSSWELDALEPKVIEDLITETVEGYIDFDVWGDVSLDESNIKRELSKIYQNWDHVKSFLKELEDQ